MKEERKEYESPSTRKTEVEVEDGFMQASMTGKNVVDKNNDRVEISEQGHIGWDGTGDDITAEWE